MKFMCIALCCLMCAACARKESMLSDGRPGYRVTCDTLRERCVADMDMICGERGYEVVSERADEVRLPLGWIDVGSTWRFNSRYWIEMRCR